MVDVTKSPNLGHEACPALHEPCVVSHHWGEAELAFCAPMQVVLPAGHEPMAAEHNRLLQ